MRRVLFRTGIGLALALLCACDGDNAPTTPTSTGTIVGSGVIASQSRGVAGFASVTVTGPLRLVLQQTGSESLVVTADDNVIPVVQSEVRGGRLFLGFAPNTQLTGITEVVCRLTVSHVRDVEASGAARVEMSGIGVEQLGIHLSGATIGSASGSADSLVLDASGASRWTGSDLGSRDVTASLSGASYGLVRARDSLVANVSGVSVLEYFGDPSVLRTVDGLSVVRRLGP